MLATTIRRRLDTPELSAGTTTSERAELVELRKRVKRAEMERDILKKATAFVCHERA